MEAHVKRMVAEYDQLNEKIGKLSMFLAQVGPDNMPSNMTQEDLDLLIQQEGFMRNYLTSLEQRLARARVRVDAREPHELTFGMKLVGADFTPSGDDKVKQLKSLAAQMADIVMEYREKAEETRFLYLYTESALSHILTAQMHAVKLVTNKH